MPKKMERKLKAQVRKRKRQGRPVRDEDAYVYGTMRKSGWKPSTQTVTKGTKTKKVKTKRRKRR